MASRWQYPKFGFLILGYFPHFDLFKGSSKIQIFWMQGIGHQSKFHYGFRNESLVDEIPIYSWTCKTPSHYHATCHMSLSHHFLFFDMVTISWQPCAKHRGSTSYSLTNVVREFTKQRSWSVLYILYLVSYGILCHCGSLFSNDTSYE